MELNKWKLKINNIGNIKQIIIFSINQNNIINIVREETELYFYTLLNQNMVLIQIDNKIFELNLYKNTHNFEDNDIVKAILFYEKVNTLTYINDKQNKLKDRYIYFRKYKSLVPEYRHSTVFLIIRDILNNQYFGSDSLLYLITYLMAVFLKSEFSNILIKSFIKNYYINTDKYIINGNTFNDIFKRELKEPLITLSNSEIIYAPTTSRAIFFNFKNYYKLNLYIKGKNFNLPDLINEQKIRSKYSIIICRLAINDYHHIHMPEDGILIEISEYNGTYKSIDKDYIRSRINVMNDNKRTIFKFKRSNDTLFYLVAIGSTLVSSIVYNLKVDKLYLTKEKIAYFQYGGSCVVYVSDQNIYFDKDLLYFSNENIESYVNVGEEIGNLYNSRNIEFIKNYHIKKHIIGFLNNLIEIIINFFIKFHQRYLKNLYIDLI
jgi:phosphatidylserine decarboxylase